MKFSLIMVALAGVSAINLSDPAQAYTGRAKNLEEGLKVIAGQQAFEAKHEAAHAKAMAKADADARKLQDDIHSAREARVTSHVVAPLKKY